MAQNNFEKQLEVLVEQMVAVIRNKLNWAVDQPTIIHRKNKDYPKLRNYSSEEMEIKSVSLDAQYNIVFHAQHPVYGEKDHFGIDQISIRQLAFLSEIILNPNYKNE